jgi:REP element-mobilizing transposase RayT
MRGKIRGDVTVRQQHLQKKNTKSGKIRAQSGSIHVYFRGNHQYNVFYSDEDKILFLNLCEKYSKKYDTVIQEFVLMDNHVHLQVITESLSEFMKRFLQAFSRRYNEVHNTQGKIFKTPFNSSCKITENRQIDSLLYILQNPIKAGICKHPEDYKWSSYHFHFGRHTILKAYISLDTSQADNYFKTKAQLDIAIKEKNIMLKEIKENDSDEKNLSKWEKTPYSGMCRYVRMYLSSKNQSVFNLSEEELRQIIKNLRNEFKASYTQISALLHVNKELVRKVCCGTI